MNHNINQRRLVEIRRNISRSLCVKQSREVPRRAGKHYPLQSPEAPQHHQVSACLFVYLHVFVITYDFSCIADNITGCKLALEQLLEKKRTEFQANTRKNKSIEQGLSDLSVPPNGWSPKGYLVAHLHEHQVQ